MADAPTPRDKNVGAYGVSVDDVASLMMDVAIPDEADSERPADTAGLTVARVVNFIQMITDDIEARFFAASRITDAARQRSIASTLRLGVMNRAASYVEQAAHPAIDGANQTSNADVLRLRANEIFDGLEARIAVWIEEGSGTEPEPGGGTGIGFSFPLPTIRDCQRW